MCDVHACVCSHACMHERNHKNRSLLFYGQNYTCVYADARNYATNPWSVCGLAIVRHQGGLAVIINHPLQLVVVGSTGFDGFRGLGK